MPGIEVNEEGRIEVEGKEITKITVEGKDFFDGDSKIGHPKSSGKCGG